jgi:RHS repeat-associated protein
MSSPCASVSAAGQLEGVLVALRPAASTFFYGHDQQGSTRLLTDPRGNVAATYSYSPYGQTTSHTGTVDTPLRYDGQYLDAETGCYYLQARYYNPAIAQFLTRDPLEAITGQPYTYADGDPINLADPSGLLDSQHPKKNAKDAFNYLVNAGFSEKGAAALVGNFMYESAATGTDHCNLAGGVDPNCGMGRSYGRGIAQWDDRWDAYTGATQTYVQLGWTPPGANDVWTLTAQLAFVVFELTDGHYPLLGKLLMDPGDMSLGELTWKVFEQYESPGVVGSNQGKDRRWFESHRTSLRQRETNARRILKSCS